ncbi:GNAT family N-acetyltransferase [Rhizobium sp. BK176]|uniref:GNAT family N-acetyltransferase n=1 Tax=Rhizobium sp. BK176 TaxID=2587071 RepID=UPI002168D4A1|nr:GNAT family N-acetyltransferase [Rhizobium sp. BK176]MCS4089219.1 GNAT superfamily N-acetyltransferase [Rhizobium sp. BK176]
MAPKSHSKEREAIITRACSDPKYLNKKLGFNPIVDLLTREEQLRYRMKDVDCGMDGYSMAFDQPAGLLAVYDSAGKVIGGIKDKRVLVLPEHRGQGIGAEMIIQAFETGVMHPSTMNVGNSLTTAGRANRKAAHRIAVERAVRAGVDMNPEVLASYADFAPGWTSTHSARSTPKP